MKKQNLFGLICLVFALLSYAAEAQTTNFNVSQTYHIKSAGGWDYLSVCPNNNRLYVSHGGQVNVLDKITGDSLGVIVGTTGVHGITFNVSANKGYTSNGRLNNVFVFDLKTNQVLSQIATGENPDAIMYDAFSKKIITCNGRSKDLTVIDATTEKVVATIAIGGKPETAVSDGAGKIYVNNEEKNEIDVIDIQNYTVINRWTIAPGEEPTGLAIDLKNKRLFAGCGNKLMIVVDAKDGSIVAKLPIGEGCDGIGFDNKTKNVFASNGRDGTLTVYHQKSANDYELVKTIETKKGARTICVDSDTHKIYLPTADFEAAPAVPTTPPSRPKMIPGTFQVLVVESK